MRVRLPLLFACLGLAGCGFVPRTIETPDRHIESGFIAEQFEVLGVGNRNYNTPDLDRPTLENGGIASHEAEETIEVPATTKVIVAAIRGWGLAYGRWDAIGDNHWGTGRVNVWVKEIKKPDPNTNKQEATIVVQLVLSDTGVETCGTAGSTTSSSSSGGKRGPGARS